MHYSIYDLRTINHYIADTIKDINFGDRYHCLIRCLYVNDGLAGNEYRKYSKEVEIEEHPWLPILTVNITL